MEALKSIKTLCPTARLYAVLCGGYKSKIQSARKSNSCIYAMIIADEIYIGSTKQIGQRANQHLRSLIRQQHASKTIQSAYDKVKLASIWILEDVEPTKELTRREQDYINAIKPSLNIAPAIQPRFLAKEERKQYHHFFQARRERLRSFHCR